MTGTKSRKKEKKCSKKLTEEDLSPWDSRDLILDLLSKYPLGLLPKDIEKKLNITLDLYQKGIDLLIEEDKVYTMQIGSFQVYIIKRDKDGRAI